MYRIEGKFFSVLLVPEGKRKQEKNASAFFELLIHTRQVRFAELHIRILIRADSLPLYQRNEIREM